MTTDALTVAVIILAFGLAATAIRAFSVHKEATTLAGYFLGNRKLGPQLTNQNFWATSFALANGLAYFSTLGYKYGFKAVLFQVPWFLSFVLLAWQAPKILIITRNKTLHKFLGEHYGNKVRLLSACISLLAVLSTVLYEIHVSSQIILQTLRRETISIGPDFYVFILVTAILAIWYVDAGGFIGTAKTDKIQNGSGFYATCGLIIGVVIAGFSLSDTSQFSQKVMAATMGSSEFGYEAIPLLVVSGVLCYASVWNFVDPSNWQAWSANSDLTDRETVNCLKNETLKAAGKMLIFPCAAGVIIGVLSRSANIGVNEYDHFAAAVIVSIDKWATLFGLLAFNSTIHTIIVGLLSGLMCFGLFSLALSTIDSYMISASQTYCWDLHRNHRNTIENIICADDDNPTPEIINIGKPIVQTAKHFLYIAFIVSLVFFEAMVKLISKESDVFVIQFLMGSMLVSIAPPLIAAFIHELCEKPALNSSVLSWGIASALSGGILATAIAAINAIELGDTFNAYAWGPIASLLTSVSILAITYIIWILIKIRSSK